MTRLRRIGLTTVPLIIEKATFSTRVRNEIWQRCETDHIIFYCYYILTNHLSTNYIVTATPCFSGFKRKEFRGKLAIAITANFINKHSEAEGRVEEISGKNRF